MLLEGLGMPLCASRGFFSPPARLCPAGGVEEPLVARSVHESSLLSPRFICGLGMQELLSCGELLLLFSVPVGSPSSSLYARRGDGVGESSERFFAMFLVVSPASSLHVRRGGEAGEPSECRFS